MADPIELHRAATLSNWAEGRADRRAGPCGDLDRLRRGVYAEREVWADADPDARYLARIRAARLRLDGDVVFSHESALRLLGLPSLDPWPPEVHLLCERRSGGRTQLDIVRHCLGLEAAPIEHVHGLAVTSPARTLVDIALTRSFASAVVVADAVLAAHRDALDEVADILASLGRRYRGAARVAAVVDFADGRSESPGESLSRVRMAQLGFATPDLQREVRDTRGFAGRLDFFWPTVRVGGEYDGRSKYLDPELSGGRSAGQVVLNEKRREDRLRASLRGFVRWTSEDLRGDGRGLAALLSAAGVPRS